MKITNVNGPGERAHGIVRGHVGRRRAGSPGITLADSLGNEATANHWSVLGASIAGTDSEGGVVTIGGIGTDPGEDFVSSAGGGGQVVVHVPSSGSALSIDLSAANVFDITLTDDCALSFTNPPVPGSAFIWILILRQDATGGREVTWPAAVQWQDQDGTPGGTAPTLYTAPTAEDVIQISTLDGGTTYGGGLERNGASFDTPAIALGTAAAAGSAATTIRSNATIAAFDTALPSAITPGSSGSVGTAAKAARRDHEHPLVVPDLAAAVGGHVHVVGETHLSDGSSATHTLDQAFEPGSVEAFNTTSLAYLAVTETAPDQATVSAAGSAGDKITFSYAASLA